MIDLLCQKLADQALHLKDLVKEAIEPGGMAKLGAEYSDDLTPTSDSSTSLSEHSNTTGDSDSQCYNSSGDDNDSNSIQHFPIMDLPVEVFSYNVF